MITDFTKYAPAEHKSLIHVLCCRELEGNRNGRSNDHCQFEWFLKYVYLGTDRRRTTLSFSILSVPKTKGSLILPKKTALVYYDLESPSRTKNTAPTTNLS